MDFALDALLVIIGIVVLLVGGDFLVRGSVALARKAGIPPLIVGLTVVAFGTSAPEMVVSVAAALSNAPGLAIGNIVGSNIANLFLVLGLPALIAPLLTTASGVRRNTMIALAASVLLVALTWDRSLDLTDGLILAGLILVYILYLAIVASRTRDDPVLAELTDVDHMDGLPKTNFMLFGFLALGIIALPIGANLIVEGAGSIAAALGVSEAVIGLTVLAFGTSLPELATAVVAASKRQSDVAIGNVIGSNIFNIFAVGGITGIAAGMTSGGAPIEAEFFALDYWVMLGSILLVTLFVFTRRPITRMTGAVLFLGYCAYIAALAYLNLA